MSKLKKYLDQKGKSVPYLFRDEASGAFFAVKWINGKTEKEPLNTTNPLEAKVEVHRALAKLLEKAAASKQTADVKKLEKVIDQSMIANRLVRDYWKEYRDEQIGKEVAPATLKKMDSIWKIHLTWVADKDPKELQATFLKDFKEWHDKKFKGQQLVNVYKYLGAVIHYMVRTGVMLPIQVPDFELPKKERLHHDKKKGRVITPEEFQALSDRAVTERHWIMLQLAYYCGPRKMEIASLRMDQLVTEKGVLYIDLPETATKMGIQRVFPVPEHVVPRLKRYIQDNHSPFVFPRVDRKNHISPQIVDGEWSITKGRAGIVGRLRYHDLRGTCATNLARIGVNPILACTMIGMSLKTYQDKYLNLKGSDLILVVQQMTSFLTLVSEQPKPGSET